MAITKEEQIEKIKLENKSARAYADSIRKKTKSKSGINNYGYNGKLSFNITGIYFLRYNGNIVYVGESKCIMSRLVQHQKEGKKVFDSWTWKYFNGSSAQRKAYEKNLIKKLKPKYNEVHKNKPKRKSKSVFLVLSK